MLINTACQNTENGAGGEGNAFVLTDDEKKYWRGGGVLNKHVMDTE